MSEQLLQQVLDEIRMMKSQLLEMEKEGQRIKEGLAETNSYIKQISGIMDRIANVVERSVSIQDRQQNMLEALSTQVLGESARPRLPTEPKRPDQRPDQPCKVIEIDQYRD